MQPSCDADLVASTDERRVDTPEGRVFVRQIAGDDPPIVVMHGFPDDHRIYNKLLPRLAPDGPWPSTSSDTVDPIERTPPDSVLNNMAPK
jgi:hypothetical protein